MNKPDQQAQPVPIQYFIPDTNSDDDIDLFELAASIIKQWKLIVIISLIGTLIGFVYAQLKPFQYQNFARVKAPLSANIASFNANNYRLLANGSTNNGFQLFTSEILFTRYYEEIRSSEFFKQFLLAPNVLESFKLVFKSDIEKENFLRTAINNLDVTILNPKDNSPQLLEIQLTSNNEDAAIQTINEFIVYTEQHIIPQILVEQRYAVEQRRKLIHSKIDLLRNSAKQQRLNKIIKLEEAFIKAKKTKIEFPTFFAMIGNSKNTSQTQVYIVTEKRAQQLFLMGTQYLQTEINLLKQRGKSNTGDDPYIKELQPKLDELAILDKITFDYSGAQLYQLDKIAAKNDAPMKPNKPRIVILSVLISLFLALVIAFIVATIIKRKENNS